MDKISKKEKALITGLLLLSVVPLLGGVIRVVELAVGGDITASNERFFADPIPVIIHIFTSMLYCILGAFQFSKGIRKKYLNWHRISGRVLIPVGMISALTGLWMTLFYSFGVYDGYALYLIRLLVGSLMVVFIGYGMMAIIKRNISAHRAWMMRAYAIGLGAGTQVITHLPFFILEDIRGELARTICMAVGWLLNIMVVEWILWQEQRKMVGVGYA